MVPTTAIELRVVNPTPSDVSEGRCRLHPETMAELDLESGDVVAIEHDVGTVGAYVYPVGAYVYPAPDDWKPSNEVARESIGIRLGTSLPGPSSNFTGDRVHVRKETPEPARRVVYDALHPGTAPEVVTSEENFVGALASAGARMPVYRRRGSTVEGFLLRVFETEPDGVVVVTEETDLEERPFDAT